MFYSYEMDCVGVSVCVLLCEVLFSVGFYLKLTDWSEIRSKTYISYVQFT